MNKQLHAETGFLVASLLLVGLVGLVILGFGLGALFLRLDYRAVLGLVVVIALVGFALYRPLGWIMVLISIVGLPVAGAIALNFRVALPLIGIVIAVALAVLLVPFAWAHWRAQDWLLLTVALALLSVAGSIFFFFPRTFTVSVPTLGLSPPTSGGGGFVSLKVYKAILIPKPSGRAGTRFKLAESIVVTETSYTGTREVSFHLPPRNVDSTAHGFLLQEIHFMPLGATPSPVGSPTIDIVLKDRNELRGPLCPIDKCPPATIKVEKIPEHSFYQAQDASYATTPYAPNEITTISPNDSGLENGITFSYIQSPWQSLRDPLVSFIGVTSIAGALGALVNLLYSSVLALVLGFSKRHWLPWLLAVVRKVHYEEEPANAPVTLVAKGSISDTQSKPATILDVVQIAIDVDKGVAYLTTRRGDVTTITTTNGALTVSLSSASQTQNASSRMETQGGGNVQSSNDEPA